MHIPYSLIYSIHNGDDAPENREGEFKFALATEDGEGEDWDHLAQESVQR
jgi:hypothetical protein